MFGIQGNFNKMPMPIPQAIPQPSEQEEILEEQNLENSEGQDYITEVLNISKIKEGFYIGDKIAAISIEVVVQFKLTHMINASGNQIINQWETIGMKYLTLNWSENPNQILFDPNDEIADKILFFIDDSFNNGEGLLAHSVKGQNRVCIVVLIYLMKKYKWSLKKSMEYLKSKKQDVDIPPFFLSQLIKFESRLIHRGELSKDIPWSFENLKNPEEKLLRNTYINGLNLINKQNKNNEFINNNKSNLRHISWADSNPYQQMPISVIDLDKDLFFKKNVRPIFSHQQKRFLKPCIKNNNINQNYNNSGNNSQKENEKKNKRQNEVNKNILNNLIKKNLVNNKNLIISSNKNSKKKIENNEDINNENENNLPNNNISNKYDNINKNALINNNIPNKKAYINKKLNKEVKDINNNIPNENEIEFINSDMNNKKPSIHDKNEITNNNFILNNNVLNIINDSKVKKNMKRNINENQQMDKPTNKNNFFINSYNIGNNNYIENVEPNIRIKNNFNNSDNQINNFNKFVSNEIINYNIYDERENNNINKKIVGYSNPQRNNIKEENIIIIANKCDNIIKNNINNYYINQIGTINNNINNNISNNGNILKNSQNTDNYNFQNNNLNNMNVNKENYSINNYNKNLNNKQNKNNNNKKIMNNNIIEENKQNNNLNNSFTKNNNVLFYSNLNKKHNNITKNSINNKDDIIINSQNNKSKNNFDKIPQVINMKEFREFNNNKIFKNNFNNILGNNHKQILGINNNDNNYYFLSSNYNTANLDSNITPKSTKNSVKIITSLSNNSNGKKFKIIDNFNIKNYSTNNNSSNKKNHKHNHNNANINNKENKNRQNHSYNVIINTRKGLDKSQNSPNQFLGRTSPRNNISTNNKYDPIISNYNPIKKNKNNNRSISPNLKTSNYQNNENYEANHSNINVNNYNMSLNKPLNNLNPNLIKRKGTPTAGHQILKINNVNNNPIKIKNNIFINIKKPSTPDIVINKSSTMVTNNSYVGTKLNNTNNIFNYSINKNTHFSNNSIHKKKNKNYNMMQRPGTAPHKEKRGNQVIHNIQESKKGINNYNKNVNKANHRPASAGQGKYNQKEKDKYYKYKNNNLNGFNSKKKIEIDFGNKYKNSFSRKRLASPQLMTNNKISLGNTNNTKVNAAKYRPPSPMIKSTSINGKIFINNINKSNTNYNVDKISSFNIK